MVLLLYVLPILFGIALSLNQKQTYRRILLIIGLVIKIALAYAMTYMLINYYNYGDLNTYFFLARDISENTFVGELGELMWGSYWIALFNAGIFTIMPPSIYGLATVAGFSSFLYSYMILKSFDFYFDRNNRHWFWLLILFLPVLGAQSGYIGKEIYILPAVGWIFYRLSVKKRVTIDILLSVAFIGLVRPYQSVIIIACFFLTSIIVANEKMRVSTFVGFSVLVTGTFIFVSTSYFSQVSNLFSTVMDKGLGVFLKETYSHGNLELEPFPQPFTILQNFRPFIWESHNASALVASIENSVVLLLFVIFLIKCVCNRHVRSLLIRDYMLLFCCFYIAVYLFIYSYNPNIGDLSRRHTYYYPQLIALAFVVLSTVKKSHIKSYHK